MSARRLSYEEMITECFNKTVNKLCVNSLVPQQASVNCLALVFFFQSKNRVSRQKYQGNKTKDRPRLPESTWSDPRACGQLRQSESSCSQRRYRILPAAIHSTVHVHDTPSISRQRYARGVHAIVQRTRPHLRKHPALHAAVHARDLTLEGEHRLLTHQPKFLLQHAHNYPQTSLVSTQSRYPPQSAFSSSPEILPFQSPCIACAESPINSARRNS